jgi:predicted Zn-dependent protease with MMP-like domain
MRRALLLALIVLALLPCSASASDWTGTGYIGERTAHPIIGEMTDIAVDFWKERGVQVCEPVPMQAPRLVDVDGIEAAGRASTALCRFWLQDFIVREALADRWRRGGSDGFREVVCAMVVHEVGHLAGLQHSDTGVMDETASAVPYACKQWRRGLERQERRAFVARKANRKGLGK